MGLQFDIGVLHAMVLLSDDGEVRFLVNSLVRSVLSICFSVEAAHWGYAMVVNRLEILKSLLLYGFVFEMQNARLSLYTYIWLASHRTS